MDAGRVNFQVAFPACIRRLEPEFYLRSQAAALRRPAAVMHCREPVSAQQHLSADPSRRREAPRAPRRRVRATNWPLAGYVADRPSAWPYTEGLAEFASDGINQVAVELGSKSESGPGLPQDTPVCTCAGRWRAAGAQVRHRAATALPVPIRVPMLGVPRFPSPDGPAAAATDVFSRPFPAQTSGSAQPAAAEELARQVTAGMARRGAATVAAKLAPAGSLRRGAGRA